MKISILIMQPDGTEYGPKNIEEDTQELVNARIVEALTTAGVLKQGPPVDEVLGTGDTEAGVPNPSPSPTQDVQPDEAASSTGEATGETKADTAGASGSDDEPVQVEGESETAAVDGIPITEEPAAEKK